MLICYLTRKRKPTFETINNSYKEKQEEYGFKTKKHTPHIKEMDRFDSYLIGLVMTIKFNKIHNNIQQQMSSDIRRIRESNCIFTKSDKSGNLYEVDKKNTGKWYLKRLLNIIKSTPLILKKI